MSLGRVLWVSLFSVAMVACGGRAIVDVDGSTAIATDAGAGLPDRGDSGPPIDFEIHDPTGAEQARCSEQLSQFAASATLIDQEYDGTCTRDSDCHTASVRTNCLHACVAVAVDIGGYSAALSNAGDCSACPPRGSGDPCARSLPACDRGHCVARAQ